MTDDGAPASAIARLRGPSGQVAGAAFLVTSELVVTCAHVVARLLGLPDETAEMPSAEIEVEFPLGGGTATATVIGWTPIRPDGGGDIAVLRVGAPAGVRPSRLTVTPARWGDPVRVFGFPDGLAEPGLWVAAELRDRQAGGWLQIESAPHTAGIQPGFSGAPVWSPAVGGVIGMVVAAYRGDGLRLGSLIPARDLVEAHPELGAAEAGEESPYRGLEPFLEEHAGAFHGRTELTGDLETLARAQSLIVLTGPSGSGKSSVVHAGLLPRMRRAGRTIATIRTLPGTSPQALLAGAVLPDLEPDLTELERLDGTTHLADRLTDDPDETVQWLAGRVGDLLIFADQLEEAAPGDARDLVALLHQLGTRAGRRADGTPRMVAVVTLRSSMIDEVVTDRTRDAVRNGWVPVPPMTPAQLRAAVSPAGVDFEPGLVGRLIDDAGDEPGHLPLLEFTLDRLWARRSAGTLTHAAYDEVGGVSGAVARYADDVFGTLGPADQARARRLLVQLAKPEDDGRFARRPVRTADLDDDLRPVLSRLTASRLVVAGRTAAGDDIAELAHQALIQRWPRLREWLADDRDFRVWQEELRRGRAAWEASDRDPGALPRGVALATAQGWADERPDDLSADDRAYVRAGRALERRRVRVLWSVVATVSVLALLAGVLAVVAVQRTAEARARLATAASRQLADDANRFRATAPAKALQLSLAAWRSDHTPEAYGALFTQYAALQPVDRVFSGLWPDGGVNDVETSRDGDVVLLTRQGGTPAVWTGMTGDRPREIVLRDPARPRVGGKLRLSPSGRYVAYADDLGGALIWDLTRPDAPVTLTAERTGDEPQPLVVGSVAFSGDDTRVMILRRTYGGDRPVLRAWEVAGARVVPVSPAVLRDLSPSSTAYFGPGRSTVVLSDWTGHASFDMRTGRRLYFVAGEAKGHTIVAAHGAKLLTCDDTTLTIRDMRTGKVRRTVAVHGCSNTTVDSSTTYAAFPDQVDGDSNGYLTVVDLDDGRQFRLTTPPVDVAGPIALSDPLRTFSVFRRPDGLPGAFLADQQLLHRLRATTPLTLRTKLPLDPGRRAQTVSPDGRYSIEFQTTGRIDVVDPATNRLIRQVTAPAPPPNLSFQGVWFAVTDDSTRLLVVHADQLVVYALPDLTVRRRIDLPVPPDLGAAPATDLVSDRWATSVLTGAGDDVLVLHAALLTRWDIGTGARISESVPLRPGDVSGQRRSAQLAFAPARRPGRPGQVAVVEPNGRIQIWDLDERRMMTETQWDTARTQDAVVFTPDGSAFAATSVDGQTGMWWTATAAHRPGVFVTGQGGHLLGFTPRPINLVTVDADGSGVRLWDPARGKQLTELTAAPDGNAWTLEGDTLTNFGPGVTRTVRLDPDMWFRTLCAAADRPFTDEELVTVSNDNGDPRRPCR